MADVDCFGGFHISPGDFQMGMNLSAPSLPEAFRSGGFKRHFPQAETLQRLIEPVESSNSLHRQDFAFADEIMERAAGRRRMEIAADRFPADREFRVARGWCFRRRLAHFAVLDPPNEYLSPEEILKKPKVVAGNAPLILISAVFPGHRRRSIYRPEYEKSPRN